MTAMSAAEGPARSVLEGSIARTPGLVGAQHSYALPVAALQTCSGLDLVGGRVPRDGGVAEVGLVSHVAGQGGVVAENGVFGDGLVVLDALEKFPEVRLFLVPGDAAIDAPLGDRLLPGLGVMFLVPLGDIGFTHGLRITDGVVAGRFVLAGLRKIGNRVLGDFEDSF